MANPTLDVAFMLEVLREKKDVVGKQLTQAVADMSSNPSSDNHARLCNISENLLKAHDQIRSLADPNHEENSATPTTSMSQHPWTLTNHSLPQHAPSSRALSEWSDSAKSHRQGNIPARHNSTEEPDTPRRSMNQHPARGSTQAREYRERINRNDSAAPRMSELPLAFPGTIYSHIVLMGGTPVQLKCYVCNATRGKWVTENLYFSGTRGYHVHLRYHPSESGLSLRQVLAKAKEAKCLLTVDEDDIRRIRNGEQPRGILKPSRGIEQEYDQVEQEDDGEEKRNDSEEQEDIGLTSDAECNSATALPANPKEFDQLDAARYPTVLYVDGQWVEMWCRFCGTNIRANKGNKRDDWFASMRGFQDHALTKHKNDVFEHVSNKIVTMRDIAKLNAKRPLSLEDVQLIRDGKEPKHKIVKYVDFETPFAPRGSWARSHAEAKAGLHLNDSTFPLANSIAGSSPNRGSVGIASHNDASLSPKLSAPDLDIPSLPSYTPSSSHLQHALPSLDSTAYPRPASGIPTISAPDNIASAMKISKSGTSQLNTVKAGQNFNEHPKRVNRGELLAVDDFARDEFEIKSGTKRRKRSMTAESADATYGMGFHSIGSDDDDEESITVTRHANRRY